MQNKIKYDEAMMKTYTIPELAKEIGESPDVLYKARRNKAVSKRLAAKLEAITGIQRIRWLYPGEYDNPWKVIAPTLKDLIK